MAADAAVETAVAVECGTPVCDVEQAEGSLVLSVQKPDTSGTDQAVQ